MIHQIVFKNLLEDPANLMGGILLDNGDMICGCCGGLFPQDERGITWELVTKYEQWIDLEQIIREHSEGGIEMSDLIKPMLCLSTAHLKPETFKLLANDEIECCIFYQKIDCSTGECYGGWLYISDCGSSDSINQHEDLKALVDYCDSKDIEWAMFDSDEAENANLPVYNEEWTAYAEEKFGDMMLE